MATPGPTVPGLHSERTEAFETAYQSGLKTPAEGDAIKTPIAPRTNTKFQTPNTGVRGGTGFAPGKVSYEEVVAEAGSARRDIDGDSSGKNDHNRVGASVGGGGDGDGTVGDGVDVGYEGAGGRRGDNEEQRPEKESTMRVGAKGVGETTEESISQVALASLHKQIEDAMSKIKGPIETMAAQEKEQLLGMTNLVQGLRSEVKRVTAEQQKTQQLQVKILLC